MLRTHADTLHVLYPCMQCVVECAEGTFIADILIPFVLLMFPLSWSNDGNERNACEAGSTDFGVEQSSEWLICGIHEGRLMADLCRCAIMHLCSRDAHHRFNRGLPNKSKDMAPTR